MGAVASMAGDDGVDVGFAVAELDERQGTVL
jgi:hypothetical protein